MASSNLVCFGLYKPQMQVCKGCTCIDECKSHTFTGKSKSCYGFCKPNEQKCLTCNVFQACRKQRLAQIVKKNSVDISVKAVVTALEKAEAFIRFANPIPSNLMEALASQSFLDADTGRSYVVADILKSLVAGTIKIQQETSTPSHTLEHVKKVAQNTPDFPFKKRKPPAAVVIAHPPKKDDDGWKEMECIDNDGFEDYFDKGMTYLVTRSPQHPEDALIAVDRYGEEREVSFVRFQDANGFYM